MALNSPSSCISTSITSWCLSAIPSHRPSPMLEISPTLAKRCLRTASPTSKPRFRSCICLCCSKIGRYCRLARAQGICSLGSSEWVQGILSDPRQQASSNSWLIRSKMSLWYICDCSVSAPMLPPSFNSFLSTWRKSLRTSRASYEARRKLSTDSRRSAA